MPYRHRLDVVRIGERCCESWDRMEGDERVRFCATCRKHVYSARDRSLDELKPILDLHEGQGAVSLAVRADGTLVSTEGPSCAEARRARHRGYASRVLLQGGAVIALATAFVALGVVASPVTPPGEKRGAIPPLVEVTGPYLRHPDYLQTRLRARFVTRHRPSGVERTLPVPRAATRRANTAE